MFEPFEEVIKEKVTAKNFKAALDAKLAETMAMKGFKIANQEALFFEGSANVIMLVMIYQDRKKQTKLLLMHYQDRL